MGKGELPFYVVAWKFNERELLCENREMGCLSMLGSLKFG